MANYRPRISIRSVLPSVRPSIHPTRVIFSIAEIGKSDESEPTNLTESEKSVSAIQSLDASLFVPNLFIFGHSCIENTSPVSVIQAGQFVSSHVTSRYGHAKSRHFIAALVSAVEIFPSYALAISDSRAIVPPSFDDDLAVDDVMQVFRKPILKIVHEKLFGAKVFG